MKRGKSSQVEVQREGESGSGEGRGGCLVMGLAFLEITDKVIKNLFNL